MRTILNKTFLLFICAVACWSCEKEEDRAIAHPGTAPALTASATNLVLNQEDKDQNAVTFTWNKSNFGYPAAVNYTLQFGKKGDNFATFETLNAETNLTRSLTVNELNNYAAKLGLQPAAAGEMEVRVKSSITDLFEPVYSPVTTVMVTPFVDIVDYPAMYLPGGYQGWAPVTAAKIVTVSNDNTYEGYVNLPDANTEFKITPAPNWDNDYGVDAETTDPEKPNEITGILKEKGGNIKVTSPGYYKVNADLTAKTFSVTKTTWGVIGDATAGAWDADQDLTFDPVTQTWNATLPLTVGKLKFRANDAWDLNFGDNDPANGFLKYGGADISVTEAGNYQITLDLSVAGNYRYTLKKI